MKPPDFAVQLRNVRVVLVWLLPHSFRRAEFTWRQKVGGNAIETGKIGGENDRSTLSRKMTFSARIGLRHLEPDAYPLFTPRVYFERHRPLGSVKAIKLQRQLNRREFLTRTHQGVERRSYWLSIEHCQRVVMFVKPFQVGTLRTESSAGVFAKRLL